MGRGVLQATVHGVTRTGYNLPSKPLSPCHIEPQRRCNKETRDPVSEGNRSSVGAFFLKVWGVSFHNEWERKAYRSRIDIPHHCCLRVCVMLLITLFSQSVDAQV